MQAQSFSSLLYEQQVGSEHPDMATSLNNLALLYYAQGKYEQAKPLYVQALEICEQQLWPEHPHTQAIRRNYASLLHTMRSDEETT